MDSFRIIDMTWHGVGPYCTFLCTLMGAECIKVESRTRKADSLRRHPFHHELNVNKLSATLNLKDARSLHLFKQLVAISDAVVENFSPGALARLGLDFAELRKWNPSIVVASMSAHGASGPESHGKGLAAIFGAAGGASFVTGYEDGPPVEARLPADLASGTAFCFALLTALYHAKACGQAVYVDGASREVMSTCIGETLLDALVNSRNQGRRGNDHPIMAPHNAYPCAGRGRWITIAVSHQREWEALCSALDKQEWQEDPRFADQVSRWRHRRILDTLVGEWTRNQDAAAAVETLQRNGVPATVSFNAQDLRGDPHLSERGLFVDTEDEEGNPYFMTGGPWRFLETSWKVYRRPPKVGEHNRYVFCDLLAMPETLFEELVRDGVIV
ncbi:MAG: CoA transferase [Chloroflexi bacterium]|nr:CoA transferase [Chloroflexota bacterium]